MDEETSDRTFAPIDPTYGQRSAFPALGDVDENDGSVQEALAYLRSVRSEASLIPHLLVSKDNLESQQILGDSIGYYEDGAYTGFASSEFEEDDLNDDISPNQKACYEALRSRFSASRSTLGLITPRSGLPLKKCFAALDPRSNHAQYSHAFLYTFPATGEIARTSQDTILLGLKRYESVLTKRNLMIGEMERSNLGAWAWALLAKCRPAQQMDGEDIAVVREIGKTAIKIVQKIRHDLKVLDKEGHALEQEEEFPRSEINDHGSTKDQEQSVIFALDILITIIGEDFGQRDLLDAREPW